MKTVFYIFANDLGSTFHFRAQSLLNTCMLWQSKALQLRLDEFLSLDQGVLKSSFLLTNCSLFGCQISKFIGMHFQSLCWSECKLYFHALAFWIRLSLLLENGQVYLDSLPSEMAWTQDPITKVAIFIKFARLT